MNTYYSFCVIIGLTLGSFYNVVGLSVPIKQSFTNRRSACPTCKKTLSPFELIPVLSYVIQRGKCRGCKSRISPLYPLIELTTGLLFAAAPLVLGWTSELFIAWALISLFMIITVSDIAYMLIPDKILLFFTAVFLCLRIWQPLTPWFDSILGAAAGFLLLLLIAVVSKGGMGGGDIKLFAVLGLLLGMKSVLLSFMFSTFFGAVFGIVGLLIGAVERKKPIPFGPFIAMGTLAAYFFGERIVYWYTHIFIAGF
ncbi:prepilin peptidase [Bacillus sp. M6-12]|uniref:prepilin peptidase n=1 Tax=Bacillus sp. M6-12 TaxID=2054166 RepID=UPI000C78688F|nr:A24 family peptidase [Bacillus sp. M6-12]PLS16862.1 prepilin peptidase [Bacillus sp. M6-12]